MFVYNNFASCMYVAYEIYIALEYRVYDIMSYLLSVFCGYLVKN